MQPARGKKPRGFFVEIVILFSAIVIYGHLVFVSRGREAALQAKLDFELRRSDECHLLVSQKKGPEFDLSAEPQSRTSPPLLLSEEISATKLLPPSVQLQHQQNIQNINEVKRL
jgi:hypothetical protein